VPSRLLHDDQVRAFDKGLLDALLGFVILAMGQRQRRRLYASLWPYGRTSNGDQLSKDGVRAKTMVFSCCSRMNGFLFLFSCVQAGRKRYFRPSWQCLCPSPLATEINCQKKFKDFSVIGKSFFPARNVITRHVFFTASAAALYCRLAFNPLRPLSRKVDTVSHGCLHCNRIIARHSTR
jgi:hypothetical protein